MFKVRGGKVIRKKAKTKTKEKEENLGNEIAAKAMT